MTGTIQKSLHGRKAFTTPQDYLTGRGGLATGGQNKPFLVVGPSPDTVVLWDDFLGDILSDPWNAIDPTDTGAKASAVVSPATNGTVLITSSQLGDTGDCAGICSELNWKANQGNLRMAARVRLPAITGKSVFVGFSDTKAAEPPIFEDSGTGAQVSNASDAVGFLFDTQNSHTAWQLVAVAGNTDKTPVDLASGPTANVYEWLEIEVDSSGNANFYRNGVPVGRIASAVTSTVALAPRVSLHPYGAGVETVAVDAINVSASRDTGT